MVSLRQAVRSFPEVEDVYRMLTMSLGPNNVLVTGELHLANGMTTDQVEQLLGDVSQRVRQELPGVQQMFFEPRASGRPSNQAGEDPLPREESASHS